MELLYDEANAYWGAVFGLLILSFLFIASIYIFGTLLTAAEKMKHLNMIALLGVGLNIALNFMLIRHYQALGATLATLITQGIATVLHIAVAYRIFHLRVNYRLIFLLVAYFAGIVGIAYMSQGILAQWYFNFAVVLALSLIIAVATGLIDLKGLSLMVRSDGDEDSNQGE